ncbi:MAG: hypothetical protein B9S32_13320 [Verrucomicrobia bacterium Tous-C9LFEB]|nr:MAG: hypothetical protein B9S32_13320 [Verrucomicrobia bacterium Tous-C9LFEB]
MAEDDFLMTALSSLQGTLTGLSGGSSGRTHLERAERLKIRDAWKKFLSAHSEALKAGKRFHYKDPAVDVALFGRAQAWQLPDGSFWPMSWAEQAKAPVEEVK